MRVTLESKFSEIFLGGIFACTKTIFSYALRLKSGVMLWLYSSLKVIWYWTQTYDKLRLNVILSIICLIFINRAEIGSTHNLQKNMQILPQVLSSATKKLTHQNTKQHIRTVLNSPWQFSTVIIALDSP